MGAKFKKYFFLGIAVILPVFITLYALILVFHFTDSLIGKSINAFLLNNLGFSIPLLGFFLVIFIILAIGFICSHFIGRELFLLLEKVFQKIPLVSNIYPPAKQLSNFLFSQEEKEKFKKIVLVEYPGPGSYAIGFVTNENLEALRPSASGKLVSVFLPFPPTPLSGFMLLVSQEKILPLDISMEEAMKFIISGGVVLSSQ